MTKDDITVGDWVRFYQDGRLVVGVVQYPPHVRTSNTYVYTDAGEVAVVSICEVRKSPP